MFMKMNLVCFCFLYTSPYRPSHVAHPFCSPLRLLILLSCLLTILAESTQCGVDQESKRKQEGERVKVWSGREAKVVEGDSFRMPILCPISLAKNLFLFFLCIREHSAYKDAFEIVSEKGPEFLAGFVCSLLLRRFLTCLSCFLPVV